jgi:site-specific DNA-methyltransferase (adenine-specific)
VFNMDEIKLYLGDCLEIMKTIPDKSIDLVLTDPPYGITACVWDKLPNLKLLWIELIRIGKGGFIFTTSQPFTSLLVMSNIGFFRHEWIYKKKCASNFAQAKYSPMKEHESVLVFGNGKVNYYPIKEERQGSGKERSKYAYSDKSRHASGEFVNNIKGEYDKENDSGNDELRYPSSVQEFNNRATGDRGEHPTQKPLELMKYFIKTYSKQSDTILDPFMGSGTTGVACKELGRKFIGIEIEPKYFEIAQRRINQTMKIYFSL